MRYVPRDFAEHYLTCSKQTIDEETVEGVVVPVEVLRLLVANAPSSVYAQVSASEWLAIDAAFMEHAVSH